MRRAIRSWFLISSNNGEFMDISELAVRLVVMMLPGVVSALIVERLTVHKSWDAFRFPMYSLLLGGACYLLMQAFLNVSHCMFGIGGTLVFWNALNDAKAILNYREIFSAVAVSVFVGVLVSFAINRKWFNRMAQALRLTEKYGDESLFYFFLNSPNVAWVRIKLVDEDLIYDGYRESFSESEDGQEVLLRDVKVYRLSDSVHLYDLDSAYIRNTASHSIIEKVS